MDPVAEAPSSPDDFTALPLGGRLLVHIQQFVRSGERLVSGRQMEFKSAAEAQGRVERDAARTAGVVALPQTTDTDTGEIVEDPVVLARYRELPAEFNEG